MGNVCVHMVSNCVETKSSSWVRPTDLIMENPVKQLPDKPPQQMVMSKEENTKPESQKTGQGDRKLLGNGGENAKNVQRQKNFTDSDPSDSEEDEETDRTKSTEHKPKPPVVSENVRKPHNVRRLLSAGLKAESVLKTKTGHLKEYYNLGSKLGHGQFGTTFLCIEKGTGEEYACKSIQKRKLETEEDVDDVRREIEIMYHLFGQPNVISIKGAYEDSVAVHMVMELCRGGELFDRIVARGHYTERKAAQLAKIILTVVQTCHSLGVMHRDLKPENFLFVNDHEDSPLKAIDFGLSVFFKPGETFSDIVGSPYYVAPEVLNKSYGLEADIWSAGVMIYVLLSGSAPFWGETEEEIFYEVLHGDLDLSSDPWPEVSENAKDLIRKMLERNPGRRLTAHQVLSHPWIQDEGSTPDRPLDPGILTRLKRFSATDKLKKMGLMIIAESLSKEKIHGLKETFNTIDKDLNGRITYKELKNGLEKFGVNLDHSEIIALMEAIDGKKEEEHIFAESKCLENDYTR
ncbi:PREDICTED: calcium-dependent protein kinase 25 isoform X2 [Tarenaya hassleriana]|uniref:calcium-dependent protein kinase 25 isoform X2 n=1 Tax=Tarenaya hassleriana TaxID=28532 RepID=UPI00053C775B|nr:PREDICTED: calcium-dependent protein kinase 25 isoform X2 [Tarenaya hassleriana]